METELSKEKLDKINAILADEAKALIVKVDGLHFADKRKKTRPDIKEIAIRLTEAAKYYVSVTEAEEILIDAINARKGGGKWEYKISSGGSPLESTLSEEEKDILKDIYYLTDANNARLLFKYSDEVEAYKSIPLGKDSTSMVQRMAAIHVGNKTAYISIYEKYIEACNRLADEKKLDETQIFGVVTRVDEDEQKVNCEIMYFQAWLWDRVNQLIHIRDKQIDKIVPLTTNKDTKAYAYFDEDLIKEMPTPDFDDFATVFTEDQKEVLLAWIYSILDDKNSSRQALWLQDEGFGGKSQFIKAISEYFNELSPGTVKAAGQDALTNQFSIANLYGARLITFPDCKNTRLIQSEKIHAILGGDMLSVEDKGERAFHAAINSKILIASNAAPEINTEFVNEMSRVIYIRAGIAPDSVRKKFLVTDEKDEIIFRDGNPILKGYPLSTKLKGEMPGILFMAKKAYEKLCPNRAEIIIPDSVYENMRESLGASEQEDFIVFLTDNCEIEEGGKVKRADLNKLFKSQVSKSNFDFQNFKRFISKQYGVEEKQQREGKHKVKYYIGIRKKNDLADSLRASVVKKKVERRAAL